jgi:TetR/AcrR family transcriptional regulator, transcriptional repressor for nem operon
MMVTFAWPPASVSREQAQRNRECGFGVGVADLMQSAGLTHGGLYAQFESKEHLMAEACEHATQTLERAWRDVTDRAPNKRLSALAAASLSTVHRDRPGAGCIAAALGADASRQGPLVRSTFTAAVKRFFGLLSELIPCRTSKARRRQAIVSYAAMVGGMVLARGVDDEALSAEILEAVRLHLVAIDVDCS